MACGKSLKDESSKVIAVIGDGSLTAGLAFEGLNQAGSQNNKDSLSSSTTTKCRSPATWVLSLPF